MAKLQVRPDRVDHALGGGEGDRRPIARREDLVFPGVNLAALMIARAGQPMSSTAPSVTGRLRLTRSPADHP
jgi:hypothetical protein